jgi:hypothetical protein
MILGQVMKRTRRCRTVRQRKTQEAPPPPPFLFSKFGLFCRSFHWHRGEHGKARSEKAVEAALPDDGVALDPSQNDSENSPVAFKETQKSPKPEFQGLGLFAFPKG